MDGPVNRNLQGGPIAGLRTGRRRRIVFQSGTGGDMAASRRASLLRGALDRIGAATSLRAAETALDGFAAGLGMPTMAWAPDVASPRFDARMDGFMRRHGWPAEVLSLWWDQHVMLNSPLYIRCRFEHLPFAWVVSDTEYFLSAQLRWIQGEMVSMGLKAGITVAILLPRARIAMLTWLGSQAPEAARALVAEAGAEMIMAAHLFMRVHDRERGLAAATPEDFSRLTPREWDCLRLVAQGHHDDEVASLTGLARTTVRYHLKNVMRKLGATNRVQAAVIAAQLGLIGPVGR